MVVRWSCILHEPGLPEIVNYYVLSPSIPYPPLLVEIGDFVATYAYFSERTLYSVSAQLTNNWVHP